MFVFLNFQPRYPFFRASSRASEPSASVDSGTRSSRATHCVLTVASRSWESYRQTGLMSRTTTFAPRPHRLRAGRPTFRRYHTYMFKSLIGRRADGFAAWAGDISPARAGARPAPSVLLNAFSSRYSECYRLDTAHMSHTCIYIDSLIGFLVAPIDVSSVRRSDRPETMDGPCPYRHAYRICPVDNSWILQNGRLKSSDHIRAKHGHRPPV